MECEDGLCEPFRADLVGQASISLPVIHDSFKENNLR